MSLFRWWRHKQLDEDDPGREATEIRSSVDETSDFLILPLNISRELTKE